MVFHHLMKGSYLSIRNHQGRYQKLSAAQIDQICLKHERFLKSKPGGQRASFAWTDVTGMDISGRNLADADFTAAIMCEVNLTAAILDHSSFYCADLQNARLERASLVRSDMRGASLRGANLFMADLTDSDLREGSLALPDKQMGLSLLDIEKLRTEVEGVNLRGANLSRSKLSGIQGIKADFTDAVMHQVRLQRANLKQAILTNADLAGADLSGADLSGANLTDAVLVGAKTDFMRTHHTIMTGVLTDLPSGKPIHKAQFFDSLSLHALWVRTQGLEGSVAMFDNFDLREAGALNDMDLTALQAKNAVLFGMNLKGARTPRCQS